MEISAIKERLSLSEVLKHYNLQPKNNMLKCFMHDDKTASLQVNLEKNFYKCHACGKTGDVIQFIEDYEKISKHEAIKKAKGFLMNSEELIIKNIRGTAENLGQADFSGKKSALFLETQSQYINADAERGTAKWQAEFLGRMLVYFKKGFYNSKPAREYLQKRSLDFTRIDIGYNSGQFHHGERKTEELVSKALECGLLLDKGITSRTGEKAYQVFANKCIAFPLRNKENKVVSFYFRSILEDKNGKHFYMKNRSGIYPGYPKQETRKLILTEAIIDCASLLQIKEIRDNYGLISCFGTNGLNEEILKAIKELKDLEEIIFCFDNDDAGKMAVEKYSNLIMNEFENLKITSVELPNNDVNETLQLHDETIFIQLLEERKFIFSDEEKGSGVADQLQSFDDGTGRRAGLKHQFKNVPSRDTTLTPYLQPLDFLQQKDLLKSLNQLIEKAG